MKGKFNDKMIEKVELQMQAELHWDDFYGSFEASKMIFDLALEKVFDELKEKELQKKLKPYSILHTFQYFGNEVNFNFRGQDRKIDD